MIRRLWVPGAVLLLSFLVLTPRPAAAPIIGQMRVALLVDSSSNMASMLTPFRAALLAFLDGLPGTADTLEPELTMITTGGQLRVRVPATTNRATLRTAMAGFAPDGGGNSFLETMLETDKRFLKSSERRPIFVVMMADSNSNRGEPRIDDYNLFAKDFLQRGGRAHAILIRGPNPGINSDILAHLTGNTGGYYDQLAVPNALPNRMKYIAAMVSADQP
ncbi:MAG: vWA domain-containing protein [Vicinamibacterales bacterium]